jgi:hypothetical protein
LIFFQKDMKMTRGKNETQRYRTGQDICYRKNAVRSGSRSPSNTQRNPVNLNYEINHHRRENNTQNKTV